MSAVNNHPVTQNAKDTISNGENASLGIHEEHTDLRKGPVGQNVKEQSAITKNEFADLAAARQTPDQPAATGQPLTHYHSLFYRLLSWKNPRATGISFAAAITFIFVARYFPLLRLIFKGLYLALGLVAAAEGAGKLVFGNGLVSQMRPKKYLTLNKASLERLLDDVEQFINFFVIEFQRVIFAENLYVTGASFVSALLSYWLIKFVPLWGLSLIGTTVLYMGPLIYISNQELIDSQLAKGRDVVGAQATQFKDLAAQHTGRASETIKSYAGEYSNKAQGLMGRGTSPNPTAQKQEFPAAPKQEPLPSAPIEPLGHKPAVRPVEEPLFACHIAVSADAADFAAQNKEEHVALDAGINAIQQCVPKDALAQLSFPSQVRPWTAAHRSRIASLMPLLHAHVRREISAVEALAAYDAAAVQAAIRCAECVSTESRGRGRGAANAEVSR